MKKFSAFIMALTLLMGILPTDMLAASQPAFSFDLAADGKTEKTAAPGDILTVTFTLRRTDSDDAFTMYAMQEEICYDSEFFQLVEGSVLTAANVMTTDIGLRDNYRAFYMNYLSMSGGETWQGKTLAGSFQLKVIGTGGAARIFSRNPLVPFRDGSGSYAVSSQDVTVILSDSCTVQFETSGGTAVSAQTVARGGLVQKPADPIRPGYVFEGWYGDVDCTRPWDFSADKTDVNLHLYAKWAEDGTGQLYSDVMPNDWFFADVDYVSHSGLMNGVGGNRFDPYGNTNRAMIVTILWRLEGEPTAGKDMTFQDVPAGQWYTEAIRWAAANGIVNGYGTERFGPMDDVTREQIAVILFRYEQYKGYDVSARADLTKFVDSARVSDWASVELSWANASGLINGLPNSVLDPQGSAIRCQTAAILHRFCEKIN